MAFTFSTSVLIVTTILLALITGLFYGYSCSVNPGLSALPDKEYVLAMQSINRAILNPFFFISFMGSVFLLPLCAFLHYGKPFPGTFVFLLIALVSYVLGVFGVTMFGNVPLNNALDVCDVSSASEVALSNARVSFERSWNRWHTIRTIFSVISLTAIIMACFRKSR